MRSLLYHLISVYSCKSRLFAALPSAQRKVAAPVPCPFPGFLPTRQHPASERRTGIGEEHRVQKGKDADAARSGKKRTEALEDCLSRLSHRKTRHSEVPH